MSIHKALAAAQAELINPATDAKANAGSRQYKYVTLAAVLDAVRPVLAKHGLSLTQRMGVADNFVMLRTHISSDDDGIMSEVPVAPVGVPPQQFGSALTYMRRYSILSLVGIAGEEDDDAQAAQKATEARGQQPTAYKAAKVDWRAKADDFVDELYAIQTPDALAQWHASNTNTLQAMGKESPDDWSAVRNAYQARKNVLIKSGGMPPAGTIQINDEVPA